LKGAKARTQKRVVARVEGALKHEARDFRAGDVPRTQGFDSSPRTSASTRLQLFHSAPVIFIIHVI
jgi:hypothetical protein